MEHNILILSCGTRNKVIQYFKKEIGSQGKVFATDANELAPALYEADHFFIVPKINESKYLNTILAICEKNKIKMVFSLIDPELSLLSEHKDKFLKIGTIPIVSNQPEIEISYDKFKMQNFLRANGFNTIKSYVDLESFYKALKIGEINYPVFAKPVKGSGSINTNKVTTTEEIEMLFEQHENLIIQEFMDGIEYGVDAYIDLHSGELSGIFIKEKILMRAGETDKSVSVIDYNIFTIVKRLIEKLPLKGVIDIDLFKVGGKYYVSEVNPRFGGGYPHAYECGVNIPKMILNNLKGIRNTPNFFEYEPRLVMAKYFDLKLVKYENEMAKEV